MAHFNYPKKAAYALAVSMRRFRAKTEEMAHSEYNHRCDEDRVEVVRQIDWKAFNEVIEQLEFSYLQLKKHKR